MAHEDPYHQRFYCLLHAFGDIKEALVDPRGSLPSTILLLFTCIHKDTCSLGPTRLKATLEFHEQDRAKIKDQLRSRTSLSAVQVEAAVQHLYGPSSSSSSGVLPLLALGGPWRKFLEMGRVRKVPCAGPCARPFLTLCGHFGASPHLG